MIYVCEIVHAIHRFKLKSLWYIASIIHPSIRPCVTPQSVSGISFELLRGLNPVRHPPSIRSGHLVAKVHFSRRTRECRRRKEQCTGAHTLTVPGEKTFLITLYLLLYYIDGISGFKCLIAVRKLIAQCSAGDRILSVQSIDRSVGWGERGRGRLDGRRRRKSLLDLTKITQSIQHSSSPRCLPFISLSVSLSSSSHVLSSAGWAFHFLFRPCLKSAVSSCLRSIYPTPQEWSSDLITR